MTWFSAESMSGLSWQALAQTPQVDGQNPRMMLAARSLSVVFEPKSRPLHARALQPDPKMGETTLSPQSTHGEARRSRGRAVTELSKSQTPTGIGGGGGNK